MHHACEQDLPPFCCTDSVWVGSVLFGHAEDDAPRQPKHVMQAQRQKDHPYSSLNLHFTFYDKAT